MWSFDIPERIKTLLEMTRWMGKEHLRPLGLEADRQGHPHPPAHPFYKLVAEMGIMSRGFGARDESDDSQSRDRERWTARSGVLMLEEASYWDRGMAVSLPGPGLGGAPISQFGTSEQKERFLGRFKDRSRPRWGAFAMTEPGAGSDVARIRTRCEKRASAWVINGEKAFSSNSPRADWVVVYATVDPALGRAGHRAFVVEKGAPGLGTPRLEKKMGLIAYETASFSLEDCRVPAENLLGGESAYVGREGFYSAMKAFDASRPAIAAMAIGIGRAASDHAREFVRQNYQTGRPIARYGRMLDRLAMIRRKLEAGMLLSWKAAFLADVRESNPVMASMAKAYSAPASLEACSLAMEILGDAGVASDAFVEKLFRDVKALDIVEGTGQIQRIVIARRILDYPRAEDGG